MIQQFDSDGVPIAFIDEGEGEPIVLIHGFASNIRINWLSTGWVRVLTQTGRRVVALDNRGHGDSGKPYDPAAYQMPVMARDARRLLDHLHIEAADVMGYSMGARITAYLTILYPDRLRSAVISGLGDQLVKPFTAGDRIVAALCADHPGDIADAIGRAFRLFADQTGGDRKALAACMTAGRRMMPVEQLAGVSLPVLVAVGSDDDVAGDPHKLAALIPGATAFAIPGRDHMTAVGDKAHKAAVLNFLEVRP
ncbi:MAG TPA: alpha/beta hydrolase [Afifellaceae bacterium]|nr:alpha/beta hydrolase [Afifellaceae bacterium]